jgi:predicted transcriptional regulator
MYMAYTTHHKITSYVTMLIQNDLLSFDNHSRLYSTTAKGRSFFKLYDRMKQCVTVDEFERQLYSMKKRDYSYYYH